MTENFTGNSYEIVAWARDQRPLLFQQFGSYQGEWMMFAKDAGQYYIYKDFYGSCSSCDSFEAEIGYIDGGVPKDRAIEFAKAYPSFVEIPQATMRRLLEAGTLSKVFPANIRDEFSEIDLPGFIADATLAAKLEEGIDLTLADVLEAKNQELKQRALKAFGYERFVAEAKMETIDTAGENSLLRHGDVVFAYVKDASTPRRYLLRVPPGMKTVHEAVAWTFGMRPNEYKPLIET